jgi:hypothetical protein
MPIDCYRFLPKYWYQNYSTDYIYDTILNDLLDSNPIITDLDDYTITFNNTTNIWIHNFPYAYGSLRDKNYMRISTLPSVATRLRLKKIVDNELKKLKIEAYNKIMIPNEKPKLIDYA